MNTMKPLLNQNRRESRSQFRKFCNFCVHAGFLTLLVCVVSLTLSAEETETEERPSATNTMEIQAIEDTGQDTDTAENTNATVETTKEIITGTLEKNGEL